MSSVAVIGLGYVGLPLAVQIAQKGHSVSGIDLQQDLVDKINRRETPFQNDQRFESSLKSIRVTDNVLRASTSYDAINNVSTVIICVPTPTDHNVPDLSYVLEATRQAARRLRAGQLIILESTVDPGVTRDEILPILVSESGLTVGRDFYLAHCPERIDPGNDTYYVGNINRVVGGVTADCTKKAAAFYNSIIDASVVALGSPEEAEFVKSWENTHRNVMIALANSAAIICDALDMDIDNILMGMQSKVGQFGLLLAKPGIGPGGHCIPEDIHFVIKKAKERGVDTSFLEASACLNDAMPSYGVKRLENELKRHNDSLGDLRVGLLGLAYKPNVGDSRRSPAVEAGNILVAKSKQLFTHDPYIQGANLIPGSHMVGTLTELLNKVDVIFLATGHDEYALSLRASILVKSGIRYVFDGRNILNKRQIEKHGIKYIGIGK